VAARLIEIPESEMGKFPDTNIAESLNRVPDVIITRETTGEGLEVAERDLLVTEVGQQPQALPADQAAPLRRGIETLIEAL